MAEEECDLDELHALLEIEDEAENAKPEGSNDEDELDLLSSLMEEDDDMGKGICEETSREDSSVKERKDVKSKTDVRKSQDPVDTTDESPSDDTGAASLNADRLKEEMKQMQKRMMELQKLLELQSSVNNKPDNSQEKEKEGNHNAKSSNNSPRVDKKKPEPSKLKQSSSTKKVRTTGSSSSDHKYKTEQDKRGLKILPDDGENMFFQREGTSSSSNKVAKKPEVKSKTSPTLKKSTSNSNSTNPQSEEKAMAKNLFGADSDSDWDDMDGEDKKFLSEEGKDLKRMIKGQEKRREAHQPKFKMRDSEGSSQSWSRPLMDTEEETSVRKKKPCAPARVEDKLSLQCKASSSDQVKQTDVKEEEEKFVVDVYSKIRITNPLVSSTVMKMRMDERKMISISKIHMKLKAPELQGDWVTIATVVGKSETKSSKSGKSYSIWRLNDLSDLENSVSFFLFGEVYKSHWKLDVGTVVGVLNPSMMDSMDKANSEPAFTIKNPNQLLIMGQAKDLGWCKARTKAGNKCQKFVNKKYGDFCSYHVQAEYRKTASQRLELHGSITGVTPKSSLMKKVFAKDCVYTYGGQTFIPNSSQKKPKNKITLDKLQSSMQHGQQKINTLSLNGLKPASAEKPQSSKGLSDTAESPFMDMIHVPSPGSMNLVASLKKKDSKPAPGTSTTAGSIQSITAKDLIKQHKQQLKQIQASPKRPDPLKQVPVLGKGFYSGQSITLDSRPRQASLAEKKKLKAIAAIKQSGGIQKEDPNAVRTQKDPSAIKKKLSDHAESSGMEKRSSGSQSDSPRSGGEPPKKKSRLLGNVDINSDEVKKILKAKSKHQGALTEAELEREEAYFTHLEKKEMLEEKMQSVTSIDISVFTCKQCHYTAQSALDSCKKEGHSITKSKAKKRFFACKKCKHRTHVVGGKFPTESCRKCGALGFERTSMYKEKTGPKLESEILCLRGDEVKYLNSLNQKVYMNTVVDK